MLHVNFFPEGVLLETVPQGNASQPVALSEEASRVVVSLLGTPEVSAALAALYLAGARAGERAAAVYFLKQRKTRREPSTGTDSQQ